MPFDPPPNELETDVGTPVADPPSPLAALGERIRQARKASELTQRALAQLVDVPLGVIERYELGVLDPGRRLELIADATGRPPEWFRGEAGADDESAWFAGRERAVEEAERRAATLEGQLAETQAELRQRNNELQRLAAELAEKGQALEDHEGPSTEAENRLAARLEEFDQREQELEESRTELGRELAVVRERLAKMDGLDETLRTRDQELERVRADATAAAQASAAAAKELEARARQAEARAAKAEARVAELIEREERLVEKGKKVQAAEGQVRREREELAALRARLAQALKAAESLRGRLTSLNRAQTRIFENLGGHRAALAHAEREAALLAEELGSEPPDSPAAAAARPEEGAPPTA